MKFGNLKCDFYRLDNGYSANLKFDSVDSSNIYLTSNRLPRLYRKVARKIYIEFGDNVYNQFLNFYINLDSNMIRCILLSDNAKKRLLKKKIKSIRYQLDTNPEYAHKLKLLSELNDLNTRINKLRR